MDKFKKLLVGRKFEFDVERAISLTILHRLMVFGPDRFYEKWKRDCLIPGTERWELHHLYRAMTFLCKELPDHKQTEGLAPRRNKDLVEEILFFHNRDLFSKLDIVFFDITSIYFEGRGGDYFGRRGFSKDQRPDLHQMVVGAVFDDIGRPICCEMWSVNTTDVTTLIPEIKRLQGRFGIGNYCIVEDRWMIGAGNLAKLDEVKMRYILGTRMRKVKKIHRFENHL